MKATKTPAPRRAGTATKKSEAHQALRASLVRIEHDDEALELIARLVEKLAKRSRVRRR